MQRPVLNLPPIQPRLRAVSCESAEIFDPLRGKFVALTPEEWVRQHFTAFLAGYLGYPPALMANEVSVRLNNTMRRCDTVEYKAPHVAITQKVFDQIARYNMVLGARWLVVSNGMTHYCCRVVPGGYTFVERIPAYDSIESD